MESKNKPQQRRLAGGGPARRKSRLGEAGANWDHLKKIALISDTHGTLDPRLIPHLEASDEIWHAGDIGSAALLQELEKIRPLRAVYGNIDGASVRAAVPEWQSFRCEDVAVLMTHIAGYPGKYRPHITERIRQEKPDIFICGHSHILKVIYDKRLGHLHMNPGACGNQGYHQVKTILLFEVDGKKTGNLRIVEIARRELAPGSTT